MRRAACLAPVLVAVTLLTSALGLGPSVAAAAQTLVVEAGPQARSQVPLSIALPDGTTRAQMMDGAAAVPCQVFDGRLWWILDDLPAGATKTYTVDLGAEPSAAPSGGGVEVKQGADTLDIAIDGKPFTTYRYALAKFAGEQAHRPFFYPVLGPDQTPLTRPWPVSDAETLPPGEKKDHPHHTSLWVAHGAVNGTDDWANTPKSGWQVHKGFEAVTSGPVVGGFRETLDWTTVDKKPVVAEVRTVRVYRLPSDGRVMDLEVRFEAKYGPVLFGDTKEGGLIAARVRNELTGDKGGRLVNAQGLQGAALWGKPSEWIDDSGKVDGRTVGLALFDTPGNLRYPTPWHARTYGLLGANPFGLKEFDPKAGRSGDYNLEAGKDLVFRYRLVFHTGDEKAGRVAARYVDYADPPKAAWK